MAFDYASSATSHLILGAGEAFKSGTTVKSQALVGTLHLANNDFGIIVDFAPKTVGDKLTLKGGSGARIAEFIIDPGIEGTLSAVFPIECGLPKQGELTYLKLPNTTAGSADVDTYFFVMDWSVKWTREGFRMIDVELSRREAMFAGGVLATYEVSGAGVTGTQRAVLD